MTREEIIQAITDDKTMPFIQPEQLASIVDFVIKNYKPSLPSNLDEAADCYKDTIKPEDVDDYVNCIFYQTFTEYQIADAFKACAEWMAGQGYSQEEIVEDKSIEVGCGVLPGISPIINLPDSFKPGDKIVVHIRKK